MRCYQFHVQIPENFVCNASRTTEHPSTVINLISPFMSNYYHFIMEFIPRCEILLMPAAHPSQTAVLVPAFL